MTTPIAPSVLADAAFSIGQSHLDNAKPCQDYAASGAQASEDGQLVWAAVADGCSTGGHTDIGARMWVHAVRRALEHTGTVAFEAPGTLKALLLAEAATLMAPFDPDDALATLGLAAAHGEAMHAALFGDGLIAWRTESEALHVMSVRYERNAPRYLAYELVHLHCSPRLAAWQHLVEASTVSIVHECYDAQGTRLFRDESLAAAAAHDGLRLDWSGEDRPSALLVATDGAESFEGREAHDVVRELMAVRNPTGAFMHRRLGAMARAWKKDARGMPTDDLGVAALWRTPSRLSSESTS